MSEPKKVTTDETLRIAAKIDRLLDKVPEPMRGWVVEFLKAKYGHANQG